MARAVIDGARDTAIADVSVRVVDALSGRADDVLWADAIILGTPENFGTVSGAMKYFLEEIYYPCLEQTAGLGYALFVKAGNDGRGTISAIERIVTGLKWRALAEPLRVVGEVSDADVLRCRELGMTIAAGLEAGLF